ncbi:hypothetical protein DFH27DRAFT_45434 [Peziza echinospora]|nr:hypothetical protein DFH27DRAFT_45434 [Peziza echinospora]
MIDSLVASSIFLWPLFSHCFSHFDPFSNLLVGYTYMGLSLKLLFWIIPSFTDRRLFCTCFFGTFEVRVSVGFQVIYFWPSIYVYSLSLGFLVGNEACILSMGLPFLYRMGTSDLWNFVRSYKLNKTSSYLIITYREIWKIRGLVNS